MHKIGLSAVAATFAILSFAAPSQAGGFSIGFGHGWGHGAYVTFYDDDDGPDCFWKKVKRYDKWGNLIVRKIRVCD